MKIFTLAKMVIQSVFKAPATLMYPFKKREMVAPTRGSIVIEIDKCIYCSLCVKKCPPNALTVSKADRTWAIDRMMCISCSACVDVCPKKCLEMVPAYAPAQFKKSVDCFTGSAVAPAAAAPVQA